MFTTFADDENESVGARIARMIREEIGKPLAEIMAMQAQIKREQDSMLLTLQAAGAPVPLDMGVMGRLEGAERAVREARADFDALSSWMGDAETVAFQGGEGVSVCPKSDEPPDLLLAHRDYQAECREAVTKAERRRDIFGQLQPKSAAEEALESQGLGAPAEG